MGLWDQRSFRQVLPYQTAPISGVFTSSSLISGASIYRPFWRLNCRFPHPIELSEECAPFHNTILSSTSIKLGLQPVPSIITCTDHIYKMAIHEFPNLQYFLDMFFSPVHDLKPASCVTCIDPSLGDFHHQCILRSSSASLQSLVCDADVWDICCPFYPTPNACCTEENW